MTRPFSLLVSFERCNGGNSTTLPLTVAVLRTIFGDNVTDIPRETLGLEEACACKSIEKACR